MAKSIYTDPKLRSKLYVQILNKEVQGTKAGQWSARKAQLLAKKYEEMGGGYRHAPNKTQRSLIKWTKQDWTTKSGLPSSITGERYLPRKAIESMSSKDYQRTSSIKKRDSKKGKQFSLQPKGIAEKVKKFRL